MEPGDILRLIILFILILLSAFFSSAETAFMSVNKIKLRSEADDGSKRAALILKLLDNNTKLLSTILVGNNIVNIVASSLTTTLMIRLFGRSLPKLSQRAKPSASPVSTLLSSDF